MDLMNHFSSHTPISTLDRRRSIKSDISVQCDPEVVAGSSMPDIMSRSTPADVMSRSLGTEILPSKPRLSDSEVMSRSSGAEVMLRSSRSDTQRSSSTGSYSQRDVDMSSPLSMSLPASMHRELLAYSRAPIVDSPYRPQDKAPGKQQQHDILAQINEHSQNDTWMLRKLSQEFFGGQMKYGVPSRLGSVPERRAFQSSDSKLNQWGSHSAQGSLIDNKRASLDHYDNRQTAPVQSATDHVSNYVSGDSQTRQTDSNDNIQSPEKENENTESTKKKVSPFSRSKSESLRKAYGIFEDGEAIERMQAKLRSKQATSAAGGNNNNPGESPPTNSIQRPIKSGIRNIGGWTGHRNYEKLSVSSRDAPNRNYEKLDASRQEWPEVDPAVKTLTESPKRLKRTSSENLRPARERQREWLRDKPTAAEAEMVFDKRHKNSDPGPFHGEHFREISTDSGIDPSRRISDPNSEQALNELKVPPENRWSTDSDGVFAPPSKYHRRRDAHRRASSGYSTSSSIDDRHKTSDPELKKLQQQAVINFFEMKTKRGRISSSSVESDVGGGGLSPRERYGPGGGWRDRSPSPLKGDVDRFTFSQSALVKSKSLPRDLVLAQMTETSDLDLDSVASGSMERRSRSNSAHKMESLFFKSAPGKTGEAYLELESPGFTAVELPEVDRPAGPGAPGEGPPQPLHHRRSSSGTTDSSVPSTLKGSSRGSECSTPPAGLHRRHSSQKSQVSLQSAGPFVVHLHHLFSAHIVQFVSSSHTQNLAKMAAPP